MRTQGMKAMLAKGIGIGVLTGAVAMAMPQRAEAQEFAAGVQFGGPGYGYGYGGDERFADRRLFREHERWELEQRARAEAARAAYARQQAWFAHERHEAWERERWQDRGDYRDDFRGR